MHIPHSLFDTRRCKPGQAFEAWRESIDVAFDVRLRKATEGFRAQVDAYLLGEVFVGTARSVGQDFDRSRTKIGRDMSDYYMLQFYLEGSCGARDGGSDRCTRPGDLFIVDAAQPLATSTTDFGNTNLIVPRRLLAPLLKAPDEQNMRVLRGDMPMVALFRDHLCALYRQAGELTPEQAHSVVRPTLDLAATALNGAVREEDANSVNDVLLASIRRHIDANIGDPEISPEKVAAAFGISRRKLYYVLEREGGFASCVLEERLRRCRAALVDPANRHRSISEIAEAHGFTSPVTFSRAFRRVVGMTAREVRSLAAQGSGTMDPLRPRGADWSRWIARMR